MISIVFSFVAGIVFAYLALIIVGSMIVATWDHKQDRMTMESEPFTDKCQFVERLEQKIINEKYAQYEKATHS